MKTNVVLSEMYA